MGVNLRLEAAIFDLDGTLADSLDVWSRIDRDFFALHGLVLPDDYQDNIKSMDFSKAAEYTKSRFGLELSKDEIMEQWKRMARHEYAENIPMKTGAGKFLRALFGSGLKLGLATASGPELYEPLLERHGVLGCFSALVTTTEAGKDKNHPDVYLMCAERLGCAPDRCLVFEDILPAVLAAKSAGMIVAGVADAHSRCDRGAIMAAADLFVEDFASALPALKKAGFIG